MQDLIMFTANTNQESTMKDFRQIASQVYQAREELASVWHRILEGDGPEDPPLEEHMRTVEVLFERPLGELDIMGSRSEEIIHDYCEMALSVFSDARTAALHSKVQQMPDSTSLVAALDLAEKATACAFREAAEVQDPIV